MPFTPFHMGPGLAIKAVAGRHFSLMVFGFSQVTMDIEPLVRILRGDAVLHGLTHTYFGATVLALVSVLLGRPLCQWLLDRWSPGDSSSLQYWLRGQRFISWHAAIAAAFIGTYSHVFFDSIMHADMEPLAPLSGANALLHSVSIDTLHLGCLAAGLLGGVSLVLLFVLSSKKFKKPRAISVRKNSRSN